MEHGSGGEGTAVIPAKLFFISFHFYNSMCSASKGYPSVPFCLYTFDCLMLKLKMKQFSKYCFSYIVNYALLLRISASRSLLTLARAESMSPLELKPHLYGLHPEKTSEFIDKMFLES